MGIAESSFDRYAEHLAAALEAMDVVKPQNTFKISLARVYFIMNINMEEVRRSHSVCNSSASLDLTFYCSVLQIPKVFSDLNETESDFDEACEMRDFLVPSAREQTVKNLERSQQVHMHFEAAAYQSMF